MPKRTQLRKAARKRGKGAASNKVKALFEPEDVTQSSPILNLDDVLKPDEKSFPKRLVIQREELHPNFRISSS
jgi:hypothetical protein